MRGFAGAAAGVVAAASVVGAAEAGSPFGSIYTAGIERAGEVEYEQWAGFAWQKPREDFTAFEGRSEIEYGVADGWLAALYLNYSRVRIVPRAGAPDDAADDTSFDSVSGELIYQILNPAADPIGLAVYFEQTVGGGEYETEGKILLQKNLFDGGLILALNVNVELEWEREDGEWERESAFEILAGASYRIAPRWRAGVELLHERRYEDHIIFGKSAFEASAFYAGPVFHYEGGGWWATLEYLRQLPWADGEADRIDDGLIIGAERNRLLLRAGIAL